MDNSCPATPLMLTETDSKSPLRIAPSSSGSDEMKSPSRDSPDSHCVICLGKLRNKSFTDSCLHQFCFQCLLQWSKVKAECPLCKQPFKSIIHNVRSNLDYDQYHVEAGEPHFALSELSDLMHSFNFDFIQVGRRFRYRSTMTRDYFRELAESLLARNNILSNDYYQIPPLGPVVNSPASNLRVSNRLHNSVRHRGTTEFRRNIYNRDLWVQDLKDISGRYRECSPQFYRDNPAQIHRIVPWLNREVNVLLSDCESQAAYILTKIVSYLSLHPIRSREFKELVQPYFGSRTDHFIHELYTFAHSVYDIAGFDRHAVYGSNPNYATEVQEISSSNDEGDDEIEILETIKCKNAKRKKMSHKDLKNLSLKRAKLHHSSDEPVAGPSGIQSNLSLEPLEISESDHDDVKVLDYVKPEPEVVVLSSDEDCHEISETGTLESESIEVVRGTMVTDNKANRERSLITEDNYSSEKDKYCLKKGKGKCQSNGYGLKGKQKQKYIKSRKSSCSSVKSTSAGSRTSSDSCSSDSDSRSSYASYKSSSTDYRGSQKSKSNRRKNKKKLKYLKFNRKLSASSGKNSKSNYSFPACGNQLENKKKVKSCVVVPESASWNSHNHHIKSFSFNSETTKMDEEKHIYGKTHHYPTPYWSITSNPDRFWAWKNQREEFIEKINYSAKASTSSHDRVGDRRSSSAIVDHSDES